jgi:hypothetical protein
MVRHGLGAGGAFSLSAAALAAVLFFGFRLRRTIRRPRPQMSAWGTV